MGSQSYSGQLHGEVARLELEHIFCASLLPEWALRSLPPDSWTRCPPGSGPARSSSLFPHPSVWPWSLPSSPCLSEHFKGTALPASLHSALLDWTMALFQEAGRGQLCFWPSPQLLAQPPAKSKRLKKCLLSKWMLVVGDQWRSYHSGQ